MDDLSSQESKAGTSFRSKREKTLVVDAREAARLLGISRSTFMKLHSAGKVPSPLRFGRAVRWRRAEIEAWIEAGAPSRDKWIRMRKTGREGA